MTVLSEDERKARRKAYQVAWRAANPGKVAAYRAANLRCAVAWRAANSGKLAAYRAANLGYMAAWHAANPNKIREATLRKYGLTIDTYDALLQSQDGTCAICNCVCTNGRKLAVDHDHDTKKNRGLLCWKCNTSLGKLKDSPAVLATALVYLAKHGKALTTEEVDELTRDLHHYT